MQFEQACIDGKLSLAKRLYASNNILVDDEWMGCRCISTGHIPIMRWLIKTVGVDVHWEEDSAFATLCCRGHLHAAKWLKKEVPGIDVHAVYSGALRLTCRFNHLKVAKWIVYIWPSATLTLARNMIMPCTWCDHVHIVKWILRLWPNSRLLSSSDFILHVFKRQRALQLVSFFNIIK
jgi:hypothetical protein